MKSANTLKSDKRAAPSTAWKPGQSGNPTGRPTLTPEEREANELLQKASPARVRRLVELSLKAEENGDLKTAAHIELALLKKTHPDRASMELTGEGGGPLQVAAVDVRKLDAAGLAALRVVRQQMGDGT